MRRTHINEKPKTPRPNIVPPAQHPLGRCSCGSTQFHKGTWGGEPVLYCDSCSQPHDPSEFKPKPIGQYKVVVSDCDDGGLGQEQRDDEYRFHTQAEADAFMLGIQRGNSHECKARQA